MAEKIIQIGESETLRATAKEVALEEIGTPRLNEILQDMKKALASQDDGVAIAAPQIDVPLRIFIVSKKAFAMMDEEDLQEERYQDMIFINPVIKKTSRKKELMDEGCLSVRGTYGKVERAQKTTIIALNEHGKKIKYGGSGLLSQIFQHETDHLNGVLFVDKATDIETID